MKRILFSLLVTSTLIPAQVAVLSNRYDNRRTGANLKETILSTTNVNSQTFGKVFQYQVDGSVFAQPLYLPSVTIPSQGVHNVLFVCTMNDTVYAFDADKNQTLWSVNFTNAAAGITPVPTLDLVGHSNGDIVGIVGIESTPVIDATTLTLYLVARTKEVTGQNTSYVQRLHALDLKTGAEKFGGPVAIAATAPGTGQSSSNGLVPFDGKMNNQRMGLALTNGQIIIGWSSHEDTQPYHGWVMSYDKTTLAQTGAFCDTPNGQQGGIWQSGRAPVVDDSGNIYLFTGNGSTDNAKDLSEAALRFTTTGGLKLADYFVASDYNNLNAGDLDLASSGPILMPGNNMLVGGGKEGIIYLLNPADLGKYTAGNTDIPQQFPATSTEIRPGPAFWTSASLGPLLYVWAINEPLKAFHFNGATFDTTPLLQSTVNSPAGDPGGAITISANGTTDASAILWASFPIGNYHDTGLPVGELRAFSAVNPTKELWNSLQVPARDGEGYFAKFVPPMVANGKLYMPTFSNYSDPNYVDVYGLLPTPSPAKPTAH